MAALASCSFDPSTTDLQRNDGAPQGASDGSLVDAELLDTDAATDAEPNVAADATPDATPDAAPDAMPDAMPDAAPDAAPDAKPPFVDPSPIAGLVYALPSSNITVDGVLDDWQDFSWVKISAPDDYVQLSGSTGDANDISAKLAARWDATHLYLALVVTDDSYRNNATGGLIYEGDSVQVAFDVADNGGTAYDTTDDFEFGWARAVGDALESFRWMAPNGQAAYVAAPYNVIQNGTSTAYEISLTPADLGLASFDVATGDIGFSWLVNDDDGSSREGYVEWSTGIGSTKNPGLFGTLRFYPTGP